MGLRLTNVQIAPLLLAALILVASSAGHTQEPPAGPPPSTVELKKNPIAILRELEPPANAPYELGRGDQISVEVIGRPELTSKHTIGPDGNITLPIVGDIPVADMTREAAADAIRKALDAYYQGVSVSVAVDKYSSNHILLLGAVANPGVMLFDRTPTLLEVISRGGMQAQPTSAPGGGSGPSASAARPVTFPDECIIYRGSNIMFTVELKALLEENNGLADYRLKRDDIVYVPGPNKYVSVLGMVLKPGTLRLDNKSTLPQLLAEAGGPTDKAGRYPNVQIIHRGTDKSPGKTQIVSYKDILQPKPLDLTLQSGDIIFVPESGLSHMSYVFQTISPLVNLVTVGALLH
jgi:polysaccharide export outer membrane protein